MAGACRVALTDTSFPPELKSVTVQDFDNTASFVVPGLAQRLSEELRSKFIRETTAYLAKNDGDWEFSGTITRYGITPIAPTGDEVTALNRLTIEISVDFVTRLIEDPLLAEDAGWSKRFTRYADFESSQQLSDVEDQLIDEINEQLVQDIFNEVGSNW